VLVYHLADNPQLRLSGPEQLGKGRPLLLVCVRGGGLVGGGRQENGRRPIRSASAIVAQAEHEQSGDAEPQTSGRSNPPAVAPWTSWAQMNWYDVSHRELI
jgi:hypothetical protein